MVGGYPIGNAPVGGIGNQYLSILLNTAEAEAEALPVTPKVYLALDVAEIDAEALPLSMKVFLALGMAEAEAEALTAEMKPTGTVQIPLQLAEADAEALEAQMYYNVEGVPEIRLKRGDTSVTIMITNFDEYDEAIAAESEVMIFRSDTVDENFTQLVKIAEGEYTDDPIDANISYRYKAAFVITGNTGGQQTESLGKRSISKFRNV